MQTRTSFNGGELSAEMGVRADMDVYKRGCEVLENWELRQMGGIRRRRGMRKVGEAHGAESRLVPFVYSYGGVVDKNVYLVEVGYDWIGVWNMEGEVEAEFESGDGVPEFHFNPETVKSCQVNSMLILLGMGNKPMVLRQDGSGDSGGTEWELREFEYKNGGQPWRYVGEEREHAVMLESHAGLTRALYRVIFDEEEDEWERECLEGDRLRVSFWMEPVEVREMSEVTLNGIEIRDRLADAKAGQRIAIQGEETESYWVCVKEMPGDVYVEGMEHPSCYPDNFKRAESMEGFASSAIVTSVHQLAGGGTIPKGTKVTVKEGYWEYFYCIQDFTAGDKEVGGFSYADYPAYFVRGIPIGDAVPCRGAWDFASTGVWYGSYEVRRCYETASLLNGEWETVGVSFSRVEGASNLPIVGDESGEICYLRLFITRSRFVTTGDVKSGFPSDGCGNMLEVYGYRHDMTLRCLGEVDGEVLFDCEDDVKLLWYGRRSVNDWSWQAFGERYGYPTVAGMYDMRLVFAGTEEQPQTIWMSRVNDINNFNTASKSGDAAVMLTLATTSQNMICWMDMLQHRFLLGTSEAEWVVSSGSETLTSATAMVEKHGRVGSMDGMAWDSQEKILYVGRGGKRVYDVGYRDDIQQLQSTDLTVFAPHITEEHGGVARGTLVRKPDTVAVFALGDGQVGLCTYNTMHDVKAWHRWVTEGRVLDVCALPNGGEGDRLFMVVERREGDGVVYNIEVVDEQSEYEDEGGRDYVSTVVTNALGNIEQEVVRRQPKGTVAVKWGEAVPTSAVEICSVGTGWVRPATHKAVLEAGWSELLVVNRWEYENRVGIRIRGKVGAHILAMQG